MLRIPLSFVVFTDGYLTFGHTAWRAVPMLLLIIRPCHYGHDRHVFCYHYCLAYDRYHTAVASLHRIGSVLYRVRRGLYLTHLDILTSWHLNSIRRMMPSGFEARQGNRHMCPPHHGSSLAAVKSHIHHCPCLLSWDTNVPEWSRHYIHLVLALAYGFGTWHGSLTMHIYKARRGSWLPASNGRAEASLDSFKTDDWVYVSMTRRYLVCCCWLAGWLAG